MRAISPRHRTSAVPRWSVVLTLLVLASSSLSAIVLSATTAGAAAGTPRVSGSIRSGAAVERSLDAAPDVKGPVGAAAPFHPTLPPAQYSAAKAAAATFPALTKGAPAGTSAEAATSSPLAPTKRGTIRQGPDEATACPGCGTPDTTLAVGPNNVVIILNSTLRIYNKGSTLLKETTLSALSGYSTQRITHGHVLYDPLWDRWVIVGLAAPQSASNQVLLMAFSTSGNPQGSYVVYLINVKLHGTDFLEDFPLVGMDQDAILITMNVLDNSFVYQFSDAFGVDKGFLYNGRGFSAPVFGGLIGTVAPPVVLDSNSTDFFVSAPAAGGTAFKLYSFVGLGRTPSMTGPIDVTVPTYSVPRDAHQPGGPDLETGDARFLGPSTQYGTSLWQANTVALGSFPSTRFYELDTTAHNAKQSGFFFATATSDDFNGTIAATPVGDAFVSWTDTDAPQGTNTQVRFSGRLSTDPLGVIHEGSAGMTSGAVRNTGTTPEPWGSYSGIAVDPSSTSTCAAGKRAWLANEFVVSPNNWGTAFGRIGFC